MLAPAAFNPGASHRSCSAASLSESGFARVPIPSCGVSLEKNSSKCKSSSFGSQQQPLPAPPGGGEGCPLRDFPAVSLNSFIFVLPASQLPYPHPLLVLLVDHIP